MILRKNLIEKCRKNKTMILEEFDREMQKEQYPEGMNCILVGEIIVALSYRLSLDIVEHVALRSI